MNSISVLAIAFAMSTDAFAAAIAKGAALHRPSWREALRTGAIFGVIEAITPLVGWLIGSAAAKYASEWDHWIAFTLLTGLGARMMWVGFRSDPSDGDERPQSHSFWVLALTGLAPWWLAALVCGRDAVIATGALAWRLLIGPLRPEPSLVSKACTLLQIVYLLGILAGSAGWRLAAMSPLAWLVAALCLASGADYVWRWSRRARAALR